MSPLSPYLFILSVEVLGKAIRANTNIKGITVNNTEIKLSQYTDDTTLILNGNQDPQPLVQLRISVIFLVLNLMTRKLKPYGSGRWWVRKKNFYLKRILNGLNKKVKVLGAWISTDSAVTLKLNYTEKSGQDKKYSKLLGIPKTNFNW